MPETESRPCLHVLTPGALTTVQDLGRIGFQRLGIAESGAMDTLSAIAANRLVNNADGDAVLEITLIGPKLRFVSSRWFSLTGADLSPKLDGVPLETGACYRAEEGQLLSFGERRTGLRAYLAVAGGFDVPLVLGSRSTYLYAGFGGYQGRALVKGDTLAALSRDREADGPAGPLPQEFRVGECAERVVRVIMGPHEDRFTAEGLATFQSAVYEVTPHSNRMGYRVDGPAITHLGGPIVVSEATPLGAVQVPGEGRPVILLRERGTTGGYTKIACVIRCDIDVLAQMPAGAHLKFRPVSLDEAHAAAERRQAALDRWKPPR